RQPAMTSSLRSRLSSLGVVAALVLPGPLAAQQLSVPGPIADSAARAAAIARLAGEAAAAYRDTNRVVLLDNLFRLPLVTGRLAAPLIREDDRRRYAMESDIRVRTPDGATVCAMVWRPRAGPPRLPALLQFTIYADTTPLLYDLRRNASNGYAAVMGFTRGKACSPDTPVPYVHDGADAVALIDWIARQPWSDGRVGMYGGSYSGMSPWAAAKRA